MSGEGDNYSVCRTCGEEWSKGRREFWLTEYDGRWVRYFGSSHIIKDRGQYLAFRGILFVGMLSILISSITIEILDGYGRCWPIYLTHQGALIETVYLGLAFATTAKAYYYRDVEGTKDAPERTPWYCRAAWILQGIALPASFLIFVLYWGLVYDGGKIFPISPWTHGVNFVLMVLDQAFSNQPMYLVHGLLFMVYAFLYCLWSYIHFVSGLKNCKNDRYIYASLNWKYAGSTGKLACVILFIVAPFFNIVFWCLFFRRVRGVQETPKAADRV